MSPVPHDHTLLTFILYTQIINISLIMFLEIDLSCSISLLLVFDRVSSNSIFGIKLSEIVISRCSSFNFLISLSS